MLLALRPNWWDLWVLEQKVTFDGPNRLIFVHPNVTTLDIKIDIYSDWKEWAQLDSNSRFHPAIRTIGGDPTTGDLLAGDLYFLINGWKLVVDLNTTRISGVLFSDNFDTAYYDANLNPLFPATVSNLVQTVRINSGFDGNIDLGNANIIVNAPTAVEIRQEMDTNSTQLQTIVSTTNAINNTVTASNTTINTINSNLNNVSNSINLLDSNLANVVTDVSVIEQAIAELPNAVIIAEQVRTELTPELAHILTLQNTALTPTQATMMLEMYELLGLDPTKPLIVTNNSRSAGDISQTIATTPTQTTVTRNN